MYLCIICIKKREALSRTVMFSVSVWTSEKTGPAAVVQVESRSTVEDRQPRSFCRRTCWESAGRPVYGSRWHSTAENDSNWQSSADHVHVKALSHTLTPLLLSSAAGSTSFLIFLGLSLGIWLLRLVATARITPILCSFILSVAVVLESCFSWYFYEMLHLLSHMTIIINYSTLQHRTDTRVLCRNRCRARPLAIPRCVFSFRFYCATMRNIYARYCCRESVCPSVCQTRVLWQNEST